MTLDHRALYKQVLNTREPFYKWNEWLKDIIEKLNFEYIYKKRTEFEYAKLLAERYEVKDTYF